MPITHSTPSDNISSSHVLPFVGASRDNEEQKNSFFKFTYDTLVKGFESGISDVMLSLTIGITKSIVSAAIFASGGGPLVFAAGFGAGGALASLTPVFTTGSFITKLSTYGFLVGGRMTSVAIRELSNDNIDKILYPINNNSSGYEIASNLFLKCSSGAAAHYAKKVIKGFSIPELLSAKIACFDGCAYNVLQTVKKYPEIFGNSTLFQYLSIPIETFEGIVGKNAMSGFLAGVYLTFVADHALNLIKASAFHVYDTFYNTDNTLINSTPNTPEYSEL